MKDSERASSLFDQKLSKWLSFTERKVLCNGILGIYYSFDIDFDIDV